jgi:hypothetical protein
MVEPQNLADGFNHSGCELRREAGQGATDQAPIVDRAQLVDQKV